MSSELPRTMVRAQENVDLLDTWSPVRALLRAPIADDAERAKFQRRLVLTLLLVFGLHATLAVIITGSLVFVVEKGDRQLLSIGPCVVQVSLAVALLLTALAVRARARSIEMLDTLDAFVTPAIGWITIALATRGTDVGRPDLIALLIITYTLVLRAAFIPSAALRTVLVAGVTLIPLLPATFAMNVRSGSENPGMLVGYVTSWCVLSVGCAASISYVVYDLEVRVRDATRLGQYVLEAKIGEGAMGAVYRARHAMLRRPTAIKLLTQSTADAIERFEREVQLTATLRHPNTIAVFDYGRTADGVFYYAMEHLEGMTLQQMVQQFGPQSPARVVHLLVQICGALEEAHAAGLVHRDIKPSNVMVVERLGLHDVVKVLDFGLVKVTADDDDGMNDVLGTPHFIAPEAILDPVNIDGRADLYSLGVTAYYLMTGQYPLDGANVFEICAAQVHREPAPLSKVARGVPSSLAEVVMACLEKKPEDRPASAGRLSALLSACDVPTWSEAEARDCWARGASSAA